MQFIPNAITLFRILITPLLVFCLFQPTFWFSFFACILFFLGAVSDFADGYIARALNKQSRIGRNLDPVADKIFILGSFITLAWLYPQLVPWWAVIIIFTRDNFVTILRMRAESEGKSLPTIRFAKVKTALQMAFIALLLIALMLQYLPVTEQLSKTLLQGNLIHILMILVVGVTALTGLSYIWVYMKK
ncbi:MAG: CDP-alcohol phosphatidyltransferase family protein [Bacteroidetes bacterium]|nr:CDP-alcohol phosphatidyltransferase family protein [Bacteroidota bacterium]